MHDGAKSRQRLAEKRCFRPTPGKLTMLFGMLATFLAVGFGTAQNPDQVEHHYAENEGTRLHYVAAGEGPLVVLLHGFPDFWYSWRHQIAALRGSYRVVAPDLRGYNLSDAPADQSMYATEHLVADVAAVIAAEGRETAHVVGHDWGGFIAWQVAFARPDIVEGLVLVNFPHPRGFTRELANNPEQEANSQYARNFQRPDSHLSLTAAGLAPLGAGTDPEVVARYVEAFERSSLEAMMFYYRENYPRPPYHEMVDLPTLHMPVLQFHGLEDPYLLHTGLRGTWEWIDAEYTLVTIPGANHWAHHDAADTINETLLSWLANQE